MKPVEVPIFKPFEVPKPVEQLPPVIEEQKVSEVPKVTEKPTEKEDSKKSEAKAPSLFATGGSLFAAPPAGALFGAPTSQPSKPLFAPFTEKSGSLFGASTTPAAPLFTPPPKPAAEDTSKNLFEAEKPAQQINLFQGTKDQAEVKPAENPLLCGQNIQNNPFVNPKQQKDNPFLTQGAFGQPPEIIH